MDFQDAMFYPTNRLMVGFLFFYMQIQQVKREFISMSVFNYTFSKLVRKAIIAAVVIGAVVTPAGIAQADVVTDSGARAVTWLVSTQEADGGFSNGFVKGSDLSATADAVIALSASSKIIKDIKSKSGLSPLDYLQAQVTGKSLKTGQYAKIALAVNAAGLNPAKFGGKDLVRLILAGYDAKTGVIGDNVFAHSQAILALAVTKTAIPEKAIATLESLQSTTGGWAFMGAGDADVDTTALAVQALIAAGRAANSGPAGKGIGYLHGLQNSDGGFPYQSPSAYGTDSNANSSGLVAQAMIAAGMQPEAWAQTSGNPLSSIIVLQQSSGAFSYQASFPGDNAIATIGAIQALYRVTSSGK
jgi:prenyltransferase beta subunit